MDAQAKKLLDEARSLYKQAMEVRDQYKGENDIPQEQLNNINTMLDQVEAKKAAADSINRMSGMADAFGTPASEIPLGGSGDEAKGILPSAELTAEVKALGAIAGLPADRMKASSFGMDAVSYDPDRAVKHQIATALLWKYGEKNLDSALARLPRALAGLAGELKALATQPGSAGGFLTSTTQLNRLIELQANAIAMRRIANVLPPIPGGSVVSPSEDTELSDAEWTTELATGSEDTVAPFGQRSLSPHPIAKRIKISRTLLRAATLLNVEDWVLGRLARKFNDAEENGFINGTGAQQPAGLLNAAISAVSTAASNALAPDDIINWAYSLPSGYAGRARILCNRSFIRKVRLLRDETGGAGTGQYMWQPGLAAGSPATILDWPYELSDFYPTGLTADAFDDNAIVATIGDFSYYWIVDSLNFEVQRLEELYAATNQVGFIGRKETDGMVVAVDAFRNLKIKA